MLPAKQDGHRWTKLGGTNSFAPALGATLASVFPTVLRPAHTLLFRTFQADINPDSAAVAVAGRKQHLLISGRETRNFSPLKQEGKINFLPFLLPKNQLFFRRRALINNRVFKLSFSSCAAAAALLVCPCSSTAPKQICDVTAAAAGGNY